VPITLGCSDSEISISPAFNFNEIEDYRVNTKTNKTIELGGSFIFGDVKVGTFSEPKALTIHNPSCAPIVVSSISLPDGFTSSWAGGTINPSETYPVDITFSPTEVKEYNGLITVNNDVDQTNNMIAASGNGIEEFINQIKIIETGQILSFQGLPQYVENDSGVTAVGINASFINSSNLDGLKHLFIIFADINMSDGVYSFHDTESSAIYIDLYHPDLQSSSIDYAYFKNGGTITVSNNGKIFEFEGEIIEVYGTDEQERNLGSAIGRVVLE
jgi:hypothetical protein